MSGSPIAQPIRQPVIAYVLETPLIIIAFLNISLPKLSKEQCSPSNTSSSYISSDIIAILSGRKLTIFSSSNLE